MSGQSHVATCQCTVTANGVIAVSLDELPLIREQPGGMSQSIPPRFLRHADEQTVVGLAAVLRAMDGGLPQDTCFDDWGVVAASVFPGRLSGAAAFRRAQERGLALVSPHIIPQNSLHSVASAISVGLSMRGPNFGVGGGREAIAEGLTVATSLMDPPAMPGLWLVLTQWIPEPVPDGAGSTDTETTCLGVALGLQDSAASPAKGLTIRLTTPSSPFSATTSNRVERACEKKQARPVDASATGSDNMTLDDLARWLKGRPNGRSSTWSHGLPWGGRVELVEASELQQARAA